MRAIEIRTYYCAPLTDSAGWTVVSDFECEVQGELVEGSGGDWSLQVHHVWAPRHRVLPDGTTVERTFDLMSSEDPAWLSHGRRIAVRAQQDAKLLAELMEENGFVSTGRGANDPEGRILCLELEAA
ncbi:hypothetical protein [Acuticoccus kandeliae]|uniref:hypothetical protein n=1 Tax=Acuticoccus kandeliae TaxID=2073160 RepID=UPI000D3E9AA7|nr:hypothetical protein [Acuticoccus kandeliae]